VAHARAGVARGVRPLEGADVQRRARLDGYIGADGSPDALEAEAEPTDPAKIWGNWTHEELTDDGYDLVVTVSMSNDYWGYIPTYREWQSRDFYRKALAGLGPHSSDFFATRLTRLAAELNGGPAVELTAKDLAYSPEENAQTAKATAIGNLAEAYLPVYEAGLPVDGGTPGTVVQQPASTQRFGFSSFRWVGGSNYADVPHARVERRDEATGVWRAFGDGYGEVQVKLAMPRPEQLPLVAAGQFPWTWTAAFEAYDSDIDRTFADGVRRGQVPEGTYRFVVDGCARGLVPDGSADAACSEWDATGRCSRTPRRRSRSRSRRGRASPPRRPRSPRTAPPSASTSDPICRSRCRPPTPTGTSSPAAPASWARHPCRTRSGASTTPPATPSTTRTRPASTRWSSYLVGRSKSDVKTYPGGVLELFCFRCSFEPWAETGADRAGDGHRAAHRRCPRAGRGDLRPWHPPLGGAGGPRRRRPRLRGRRGRAGQLRGAQRGTVPGDGALSSQRSLRTATAPASSCSPRVVVGSRPVRSTIRLRR
jgi:hypothetical protein